MASLARSNYAFPATAVLVMVLAAGWILLSAVDPMAYQAEDIAAPQRGFLAPDFSLPTPDGGVVALSDYRGQPVLVNLWASWCGPCRSEMPAMEEVYQTYMDQGFVVLAVNAANQDNVPAATAFVKELGLTFPILLDTRGEVSQAYQLQALPSSYFIDRAGRIQEVVIGGPMAEALLRSRVETLLDGVP